MWKNELQYWLLELCFLYRCSCYKCNCTMLSNEFQRYNLQEMF